MSARLIDLIGLSPPSETKPPFHTMETANTNKPRRTFPPLYQGTENEGQDRLAFIHILERLKVSMMSFSRSYGQGRLTLLVDTL